MFLPRPIFIAKLNDEAYYKRLYHLGDVVGSAIFSRATVMAHSVIIPTGRNTLHAMLNRV